MSRTQQLTDGYALEQAIAFYEQNHEKATIKATQHKRAILKLLLGESVLSPKEVEDVRTVHYLTLKSRLGQRCPKLTESSLRVYSGRAKKAINQFLELQKSEGSLLPVSEEKTCTGT